MSIFTKLFSAGKTITQLLDEGAIIVDVRTPAEYSAGHLTKSINIPLDSLGGRIGKLDKSKPVITCCASGMRSSSARRVLKTQGFSEVKNGGSWTSLKKYVN